MIASPLKTNPVNKKAGFLIDSLHVASLIDSLHVEPLAGFLIDSLHVASLIDSVIEFPIDLHARYSPCVFLCFNSKFD